VFGVKWAQCRIRVRYCWDRVRWIRGEEQPDVLGTVEIELEW